MTERPFWSTVFEPVVGALAPASGRAFCGRIRNACVLAALLVGLLPASVEFATATPTDVNVLAIAYAVCAVVAHLWRERSWGPRGAAALLWGPPLIVWWNTLTVSREGAPSRPMPMYVTWFAVIVTVFLVLHQLRVRSGAVDRPRAMRQVPGFLPLIGRLAYAFATVFVFWAFVTQHLKVPTGSMQPTIRGESGNVSGDRLLADHTIYHLRDPRRWEIAVFEYPLRRDILFVKRIVGLPGERLEIRDGNIWIDGEIAAKPPLVQEVLWIERFPKPSAAPSARRKSVVDAWSASEDDGWRKNGEHGLKLTTDSSAFAKFRGRLLSAELRVGTTVTVDEAQPEHHVAELAIGDRARSVSVRIACSQYGRSELTAGDAVVELPVHMSASGARLELEVVDGIARARMDGVVIGEAPAPAIGSTGVTARIGGDGDLAFTDIRLHEDIYYKQAFSGRNAFDIPDDGFVVLGDNTQNSEDSQDWVATRLDVRGRDEPFLVEAESPTMDGGRVANLVRRNGRATFVDSDGVARDLAEHEIIGEERRVPVPFVRRHHLIGRAAMIFWPLPPFSKDWRPRLLP